MNKQTPLEDKIRLIEDKYRDLNIVEVKYLKQALQRCSDRIEDTNTGLDEKWILKTMVIDILKEELGEGLVG